MLQGRAFQTCLRRSASAPGRRPYRPPQSPHWPKPSSALTRRCPACAPATARARRLESAAEPRSAASPAWRTTRDRPVSTAMACSYCARATPRLVSADCAFCKVFSASTTEISGPHSRSHTASGSGPATSDRPPPSAGRPRSMRPVRESRRNIPPGWPARSVSRSPGLPRSPARSHCASLIWP